MRHADNTMNPFGNSEGACNTQEVGGGGSSYLVISATADILGLLQVLILLSAPEGQRGHVSSSSEDDRIYEGALRHLLLGGWPESIYLLLIIRQITAGGQNSSNI